MTKGGVKLWAAVLILIGGTVMCSGENLQAVSFRSNGDLIQDWYWLRDPGLAHQAWWTFEGIPPGIEDVVLEITCLATDRAGGRRGVSATFRLGYGFPGAGMMGGVFSVQEVTLPNVSPPEDPVGYTCRGTVTIPRSTPGLAAGTLTVFAERISPPGPHVAFNKESIVIRIAPSSQAQGGPEVYGHVALLKSWMFDAADAPQIGGWYWLRPGTNQSADWVIGPVDTSRVDKADPYIYINLSALVTSAVNGGSGWGTTVKVEVWLVNDAQAAIGRADPGGRRLYYSSQVYLKNYFRPQIEANTQGIGYAAQAEAIRVSCSDVERYSLQYGSLLLIRLTRLGAAAGNPQHVAVNAGSVVVACRWRTP